MFRLILFAASLILPAAIAADSVPGLKVPAGFTVTEFAGPDLANDIYCLHVDAEGRVVVSGKGYVRQLVDVRGCGRATAAVDLIPAPKDGPMGMLWENDTLYVVTGGGLQRYTGVDGKGPTAAKPETVLPMKTVGEHEAHAVKRGPDGHLYWMCGNMSGVDEKTVRGAGSPVTKPVAGCLLKLTDDAKTVHIVADGFRNAYDFDFNLRGDAFTFDSDNERDQGLPWFEPTRFYHVIPGGNYGWLSPQHAQTWRKPPYFKDVVAPVFTVGRGSPTGVACYRHDAFPKKFQGGFFFADWTFGKVWFSRLQWIDMDYYAGTPEPFLEATGENGFAPTGTAVCPKTGDLFVSIGGRGTRGAVYRVHADDAAADARPLGIDRATENKPFKRPDGIPIPTVRDPNAMWTGSENKPIQNDFVDPKAIGTAWEGYTFRNPPTEIEIKRIRTSCSRWFDTRDDRAHRAVELRRSRESYDEELRKFHSVNEPLDLEAARLWAAAGDPAPNAAREMTKLLKEVSRRITNVHYLIVLAKLTGKREEADTKIVADYLVRLDADYAKAKQIRDRHWPLRMTEVVAELIKLDPNLSAAIAAHPDFGSVDHVWLAKVPGMDKAKAAAAFLKQATATKGYEWTAGHVELIGALPAGERREALLKLANKGFDDAVTVQLAASPQETDRPKFLAALASVDAGTVAASVGALSKLAQADDAELAPLVSALRRFNDPKVHTAVREKVVARLQTVSNQKIADDAKAWEAWLTEKHPELAKQLASPGYDAAKWKDRLAAVPWEKGDATQGKALFAKARCAACHDGGNAAGPSLQGVSKRFGRDDLLTAILDPSRDVSPRYRTVRVTTVEDKVFDGIVVYDATDGVILQTGADTTVRIAGADVAGKKPGGQSLMPVGLLDAFAPREIADLIAYLKTLDAK